MAKDITERYGSKPFGFQFETRIVCQPVPDGENGTIDVPHKIVEKSGTYYIKGELLTYDDVLSSGENGILCSNMRANGWPIVCETRNSFKHVAVFEEKDKVLDEGGEIVRNGDDDLMECRRAFESRDF